MKKESIDEFLARGGVIKIIPTIAPEAKPEIMRGALGGPINLLTLDEHNLYHGEKRVVKEGSTPKKTGPSIDFSALPEALKQKYLKQWAEQNDNQD